MSQPDRPIYTSTAEMSADPGFIRAWTSNPAIVAILLEAEQRRAERKAKSA